MKLEKYDYEIVYKKGRANANVDALSRNPVEHAMHIKEVSESETEEVEKKDKKEYSENEKRKILYIYEYRDTPVGGQGIEKTNDKQNPSRTQLFKITEERRGLHFKVHVLSKK